MTLPIRSPWFTMVDGSLYTARRPGRRPLHQQMSYSSIYRGNYIYTNDLVMLRMMERSAP